MPMHFYNHDISQLKDLIRNMSQIFETANHMENDEHSIEDRVIFLHEISDMYQDLSDDYQEKIDELEERVIEEVE